MNKELKLTREYVFNSLFNSFNYGNLGLFIGAGFSKAVVNDDLTSALSWGDLIRKACDELKIKMPDCEEVKGLSFPQISSLICDKIADSEQVSYEDAKRKLKRKISHLSNWLPNEEKTSLFSDLLRRINPSWIITTNYDLVIEKLLTGKCVTLGPDNYFTYPKGTIPIYHLHGVRLDPDSIIITQEDYVQLFRPNEYRQIKLALTIKESTTLILGYGLGDVNVLSAVDWSKNIYKENNGYPHEIIQAIRTDNPSSEPYRDKNGIIIIEVDEIKNFLQELVEFFRIRKDKYDNKLDELYKLIGDLTKSDEELIESFIADQKKRLSLLQLLSEFELHMVSPYIDFISRCIDKTWKDSADYGAFEAYDQNLRILLDIIINYDYNRMPPALFEFVAHSLDRVFRFVSDTRDKLYVGHGWDATRRWHSQKSKIPYKTVEELYYFSKNNYLSELHKKIEPIFTES
ncbi:SIR2 family protein [Paenibacillus campinasensis]|jgi:hypothetical protein|uniref:SIR2 family protein n=1 Tax=Paenibacillus campinasensis TaxID=66347 RepID=A0ABW9T1V3_9BACL|nr:SIR2 family protein [Paenibacillus campinasensis]MUG67283.1 SIR2 family protein [Paenibacillus campinasensis]